MAATDLGPGLSLPRRERRYRFSMTPLADVMRAQAADAREASRRALMEEGGKREIAQMVPVVFLVLPITVVFALFPGLFVLRLGL